MAAFGLVEADLDAAVVWPDTLPAVNAFVAMATQWRAGMSGPTGLDYTALPVVLRLTGVARGEWPGLFEDIRLMEGEALKMMAEKR